MPTQINKVPNGLLSLLDLKQLGKNPGFLSDQVIPSIDVLAAYGSYDLRMLNDVGGASAPFGTVITVPTGEVWVPVTMSMQFSVPNAGEFAHIRLELEDIPLDGIGSGANPKLVLADNDSDYLAYLAGAPATGVADLYGVNYTWDKHVFLPSGTQLTWRCTAETFTTAGQFTKSLVYYQFEV